VCLAIGAVSLLPAAYDVWKVGSIAVAQFGGSAEGTDFLNLYAGARLMLTAPHSTYEPDAQLALQQSLTGRNSLLVPFYLPPYAALLVSPLGSLAYPLAYLAWLVVGVGCMVLAARWLAPRCTRWSALVWVGASVLFLPCVLGLAQGQTAPLMLACTAAFATGMLGRRHASARLVLGVLGLALKPQFAPVFVCVLILARRWTALVATAVLIGVSAAAALIRLGAEGRAAYTGVSSQKLVEAISADPTFLLGPTLLHASHWFIGVNALAHVVAGLAVLVVLGLFAAIWRHGPATDDAILLQLAVLPVVSVIVAPYALVFELTTWLVTFWLLWRYTATRVAGRAGLLWLTAGVWAAGDLGVAQPLLGGADVAALLGMCVVAFIAWLYRGHRACLVSTSPRAAHDIRLSSS
jgi:Glycosyltransferase family 87